MPIRLENMSSVPQDTGEMELRKVRVGLVQATWEGDVSDDVVIEENIEKMIRKHEGFATIAKQQDVDILCFQELFFGQLFSYAWFRIARIKVRQFDGRSWCNREGLSHTNARR